MIQKLRWKFVLIIMSLVAITLGLMFAVVMVTTWDSLRRDSLEALGKAVTLTENTSFSNYLPKESEGTYGLFGSEKVQMPYFTIQVSGDNSIYVLANQFFDLDEEDALVNIVSDAMTGPGETGTINSDGYSMRYLRVNTVMGYRIAFVDLAQEESTLGNLARNLAFICLGTLLLFFVISLLLSRWTVRPVERSWKQQRQFVADASHELKTPLAVILSSLDMLDHYGDADPEKQQRWNENVRTSAKQMQTLVEELLVLARSDNATQQLHLEDCDLTDIVEDSLLLFEPLAFEQGRQIDEKLDETVTVNGDTALLKRIVDIYLDNACKYSLPNSTIQVALKSDGKRALLSVYSEGDPIPHEQLERIFERFYRADPSRTEEGYGLGLAIATELAHLHHGKVWAEPALGGNTFYFSMPLAKAKSIY
jgi:two-component system, OmpR family, sensor histidine kinase CiaH